MGIGFDGALKIARQKVGDLTGDFNAEVLKFDSSGDYTFQFRTKNGPCDVAIDQNGMVTRFAQGGPDTSAPTFQGPERPMPTNSGHKHHDDDDHDHRYRSTPDNWPSLAAITQQSAVEKALSYVGGGRVEKVKPSGDGWEVEINQGLLKGRRKTYVDGNGTVHAQKHSRLEMLDFDFD